MVASLKATLRRRIRILSFLLNSSIPKNDLLVTLVELCGCHWIYICLRGFEKVASHPHSGVIVENRLLSKRRLQEMVQMPPMDALRAELCAILSTPAQKTASLLSSNQQASHSPHNLRRFTSFVMNLIYIILYFSNYCEPWTFHPNMYPTLNRPCPLTSPNTSRIKAASTKVDIVSTVTLIFNLIPNKKVRMLLLTNLSCDDSD